jgi:HEAT repeat protein
MSDIRKALVRMLESSKPEVQIAAATVLGELRPSDPEVLRTLAQRASEPESFLTPFLLDALAQVGGRLAVAALVERLAAGGGSADRAGHLLSQMPSAVDPLARLFERAEVDLQRRILEILGRRSEKSALAILCKALTLRDTNLVSKASEVLRAHGKELGSAQRKFVVKMLRRGLTGRPGIPLSEMSLSQMLLVLGELDASAAKSILLRFTSSRQPPAIRLSALHALRRIPLTAVQAGSLLELLADADMSHVVRPAITVLEQAAEWNASGVKVLKRLVASENEEVAVFAVRALGRSHTTEAARACLDVLVAGSPMLHEIASKSLAENPSALPPLLRLLLAERKSERAQIYAKPLAGLKGHWSSRQVAALAERVGRLLLSGDPLAEIHLALLLEVAPEEGSRIVIDKALRLRRAHKITEGVGILMRLAQSKPMDAEGRYQLAVGRLLMDGDPTKARTGNGDPTMGYFAGLVREGFPVFDRLKRETQITPEAMLRIGSHFAASAGPERRFGTELLAHIAEKNRRSRVGEEARQMLRTEGY